MVGAVRWGEKGSYCPYTDCSRRLGEAHRIGADDDAAVAVTVPADVVPVEERRSTAAHHFRFYHHRQRPCPFLGSAFRRRRCAGSLSLLHTSRKDNSSRDARQPRLVPHRLSRRKMTVPCCRLSCLHNLSTLGQVKCHCCLRTPCIQLH